MIQPGAIAAESFAIIRAELAARGVRIAPPLDAVVERIIHSTADFEFAALIHTSPDAVAAGVAALREGCPVVADVQMVRIGISERRVGALGGALHCFVGHPEAQARAAVAGLTRSALGIRIAQERGLLDGAVLAIGNAPTALYEALRQIEEGVRPALVVGVPVGFVNTVESKQALMQVSAVPWVVVEGRKGGSPVAVAIVNALLRLASGDLATDVD
jgi:precorrin-8X/cobalt-precorrin-8 methylmutase